MKFSCYKSDLTEALQFVIRAVAVKPMTPILAGIYLKAEGSMLEIQSNNFSTGILTPIPRLRAKLSLSASVSKILSRTCPTILSHFLTRTLATA